MDPKVKKYRELLAEIKRLQDEHKGKPMPVEIGDKIDALATEAEGVQKELDREARTRALEEKGRTIIDPNLPDDHQPETKDKGPEQKVAGAMRLGDFVVAQKSMQEFIRRGKPKEFRLAQVKSFFGGRGQRFNPIVLLTPEQVKEFKAVPTIAGDVIDPQLIPDLVRVTEHDTLRLRDVLDVSRTTSNAVKYTRITSYTRAAATVAPGADKPEAALSIDAITEPVRKVAVHLPVQDEQLEDLPALAGIINGELLYDVAKHEEELIMYGDGIGENFEGIIPNPDVLTMRSEVGDTLIDIARRGITDVRRAGYDPNAIVVDPLDWENIVLQKGTDDRYVWVVVTEDGVSRLWGVPVIETVAMEDFAGNETEARNMLVGDFRRGATLWDRQDASISVGWIDKQFIQNLRTILAEERLAFGVKRPGAFRKYETQAAVGS